MMTLAAMGLACIVLGAALSQMPIFGLLGLPMTLVGGGMLAVAVSRLSEPGSSRLRETLGLLLEVPASVGIAGAAIYTTGLAWSHLMAGRRPTATIYGVDAGDLVWAAVAWLLLPSLITLGIFLRTRWNGGRLVGWWLLTFSAQPGALLCFLILASLGAPLSA